MDMPGLRLPSQSQSRLLEYLKSIVRDENENIQFIIVTSSSALIEKANTVELFMLMTCAQATSDNNKFKLDGV